MRVFSVPWSNSSRTSNIARTDGTIFTPSAVRALYEAWVAKGVSFLKENGSVAELDFLDASPARAFEESGEERIAFLGGDHSITYATFSAFRERYGADAVIISLDAHPDLCRKSSGEPLHSDWLRRLIEDGLDPRKVVGIGWRDAERDEREFWKRHEFRVIEMAAFRFTHPIAVLREIEVYITQEFGRGWRGYLTIDMDVTDPSIVPAVTTPSPGGLDQHQFAMLVKGLAAMRNVRALDVVEIDPRRDRHNFSLLWVLKVLREMA